MKRVVVKTFMDTWTLNVERLQQCCVHVGSTDGEANPVRIPFCARQVVRRAAPADVARAWSRPRELPSLDAASVGVARCGR